MARPSEEDLARWDEHVFQREKNIEQAMPWKDALGKALASEAVEIIQFIFLTTYKHHISDAEKGHAISLESEAMDFLKRWKKVKEACKKAELDTSELTEAIGASDFRVGRIGDSSWHEIKSAEMKEDGSAESLAVAKSTGHAFDLLNFGVHGFADGVGDVEDDGI